MFLSHLPLFSFFVVCDILIYFPAGFVSLGVYSRTSSFRCACTRTFSSRSTAVPSLSNLKLWWRFGSLDATQQPMILKNYQELVNLRRTVSSKRLLKNSVPPLWTTTFTFLRRCPVGVRWLCSGKEKFPTLSFLVVVDHNRRVQYVGPAHFGASNDKTISNNDPMMRSIHAGKFKDIEYILYNATGLTLTLQYSNPNNPYP